MKSLLFRPVKNKSYFLLFFYKTSINIEKKNFMEESVSSIIHYEVYVYQSGAWDLLGRYPSEQRAKAIEYARSIENSERKPTKVVRETYDLDTQTFLEALVYLSEIPKPQPRKSSPYENSVIPTTIKRDNQKKSNLTEGVVMIFMSIVFSMMTAGVVTAVILRVMSSVGFTAQDISGQFVLGMFTFFFLAISIPTAIKWVNWDNLLGENEEDTQNTAPLYPSTQNDFQYSKRELYEIGNTEKYKPDSFISGIMRKLFDAFDVLLGRKTLRQRLEEAKAAAEEAEKKQEEEEKAAEEERKKQQEEQAAAEQQQEEQSGEENPLPADQQELSVQSEDDQAEIHAISESPGPSHTVIPPELEKDYLKMTTFLSIILRVLQEKNTLLNTYARFGIELFLAGACEQLCRLKSLSKQQNRVMLSALLELLGRAPTLAELFYDKIEEYMLELKYLPVIENGAKSMDIYLNNKSSPELISLIQITMSNWLNPGKKEMAASGIHTIMFTDIVSSTHMTQRLGDRLAQQLIHRHNTIVRQALNTCGGEEIKQTGDGIMASFMWASNAIDAAVAIQKAVGAYNRESPTVPLEVRIGLNAGEPIVENNDLFGLTVQIASRVCGEAGKNQIYVSSVVKELAAGKNYTFTPLGEFNLKGIDAPQTLYEVIWNEEKPKKTAAEKEPAKPADPPKEISFSETLPEL